MMRSQYRNVRRAVNQRVYSPVSTAPTYSQNRVDGAGTRYLTKGSALDSVADSNVLTFSCWAKRNAHSVASNLLWGQTATVTKMLVQVTATNKFRIRFVNLDTTVLDFSTVATYPDTNWRYYKVVVDLGAETTDLTVDGTTESFGIGTLTAFDFTLATTWQIMAGLNGTTVFNGAIADMIFNNTILNDAALAYNGGVPLDPTGVAAAINVSGQNAASFAAGTANANGSGGAFTQAGSGSWTDV